MARAASPRRPTPRPAPPGGRIAHWLASRLPRQDTQLLTQRNVYILPTRAGWLLAVVLAVLLVASINYELNLGYLLTFLLAGSALASMHVGHGNLRGTTLHLPPPEPAFAGAAAMLEVQLSSERRTPRRAIAVGVQGSGTHAWADVPAGGQTSVQVAWLPPGRGLHALPALVADTRFPMGTFRVWTVWRPAASLLVYPAPESPAPLLPAGTPRSDDARAPRAGTAGAGEFDGVRAYRRGDALRTVVWKKAAQAIATGSDALVSRDSQQSQQQDLWLDLQQAGLPTLDQRLSRLCAWVLQADRLGADYGLRLPAVTIAPAQGPAHRQQCLEALARC